MSASAEKSNAQAEPTVGAKQPRLAAANGQITFRQVNEEIRRLADNSDFDELDVFCECEHGDCLTQFSVPIDDYEAVRRFPTHFLVRPTHLGPDERIVQETSHYVVVEKVGDGAAAAISHDPRKASPHGQTA
jgi:hypothetical protein